MPLRWSANSWENAPLMCRLFGHRTSTEWWGNEPYMSVEYYTVDNVGTEHLKLVHECDRCGRKSVVARLSVGTVDYAVQAAYKKHPHLEAFARKVKLD